VAQSSWFLSRNILFARYLPIAVLAAGTFFISHPIAAQESDYKELEGYITAVRSDSFFVSEDRVAITRSTQYQFMGDHAGPADPTSKSIARGVYVKVTGDVSRFTRITTARVILFRDESVGKLSGLGVIERVVSAGAEPVFQADGFQIRITAATKTSFTDDLKGLQDVGTNSWIHYTGLLGPDGVLVASKAEFIPAKPTEFKALKGFEVRDVKLESSQSPPAGSASSTGQSANDVPDEKVMLAADGGRVLLGRTWHKIPADETLQSRVRRIGARLVPVYQKQLPEDHPSKIHFAFYAIDAEKMRSEHCALDGLILVPKQAIERFKNDDQLAAVLADGIAYNLERQAARLVVDDRKVSAYGIAGDLAGAFVPGLGLVSLADSAALRDIAEMEEQRGRVALSLMADAGYDPQQAPEAWRLLAPKKLPPNPDTLTYPDFSGYLMSILRMQYDLGNKKSDRSK
jgi:hypothetical protein